MMTPVEPTAGPVRDGAATPPIQQALDRQGLWPTTPSGATGDRDAARWVTSPRESRGDLRGPRRADGQGPAPAAHGCEARHCQLAGEPPRATGPGGDPRLSWTPAVAARPHEVVQSKGSMKACQPGASRLPCTRAPRRTITVRRQDPQVAWQAARAREPSAASTTASARRAGGEGTRSPGIRAYGRRPARDMGEANTPLQPVLTAAAIHVGRLGNGLMKKPLAKTRTSTVQTLSTPPVCC
jgi:Transposase DDE domain